MKHFYFNVQGLLLSLFIGFSSVVCSQAGATRAQELDTSEKAIEARLGQEDVPARHMTEDGRIVAGGVTNSERVQLALKVLNKIIAIIEYAPNIDFPGIHTGMRDFLGGGKYSETILKSDLIKVLELVKDIFADKDSVFVSLARIMPSKKVHAVARRVEDMGKGLNTLIDTLMIAKKMSALSKKGVGELPVVVPTKPEVIEVTDEELDFE